MLRFRVAACEGHGGLFKAEIQNSRFKIQNYGIGAQLAKEPHTSGLADASCGPSPGEAAARTTSCEVDSSSRTSPQPSGWACDAKEQPAARGRLRAARRLRRRICGKTPPPGGGCGLRRLRAEPQIQNKKRRIKNDAGAACEGTHKRTCGRELRAFAGRSCGPLRPFGRKFRIQD